MKTLTGFRPTGRLTLGHYFAVVLPARKHDATVLVADYHAPEAKDVEANLAVLARFGVTHVVRQKDVHDPALFFRLLVLAKDGDLRRMTQYKAAGEGDRTAHLLTYPVLMAADVAGYEAVYVGEDQAQHLEYARKLLRAHNRAHGTSYPVPEARVVAGRVMDLRDSSKKMSKSRPEGALFLDDSPADVRRKVRRAVTDEAGLANLTALYGHFVGGQVPTSNQELKELLAEALVAALCG